MSQANEVELNSGASSRSSSPASDDIDMEGAPTTSRASQSHQQQQFNTPLSPVSPQKNGSALQSGGNNNNSASPRVHGSKQAGGQGQSSRAAQPGNNNRKRPGQSKHDDRSGYSRGATGLMDPAQGSAYERLLDLNYPRDYGDPVMRYDEAIANSGSTSGQQMNTHTVISTSS